MLHYSVLVCSVFLITGAIAVSLSKDNIEYAGCFYVSLSILEYREYLQKPTLERCIAMCHEKGTRNVGIDIRNNDCYCGDDIVEEIYREDESKCDMPCPGPYGDWSCGGGPGLWVVSVYVISPKNGVLDANSKTSPITGAITMGYVTTQALPQHSTRTLHKDAKGETSPTTDAITTGYVTTQAIPQHSTRTSHKDTKSETPTSDATRTDFVTTSEIPQFSTRTSHNANGDQNNENPNTDSTTSDFVITPPIPELSTRTSHKGNADAKPPILFLPTEATDQETSLPDVKIRPENPNNGYGGFNVVLIFISGFFVGSIVFVVISTALKGVYRNSTTI